MAQADMFLKLTNIKGEAVDSKHKDEIDVLSWSFGASQAGTAHLGGGSGSGKVQIQDLTITHYVDAASTDLLKHLTSGKHIDEGLLTVRKAGGTALEYLKIKMIQVMVTHISNGGGAGQDRVTENVTLNFRKFTQTYYPQDAKGHAKPHTEFTWDIAAASEH
jgi:type VI secretion system secreted protein Hcp